jgi:hypothetical protein
MLHPSCLAPLWQLTMTDPVSLERRMQELIDTCLARPAQPMPQPLSVRLWQALGLQALGCHSRPPCLNSACCC